MLKENLPVLAVWMAQEAIMEGVKAFHRTEMEYSAEKQKEQAGQPYNYTLAHAYRDGVNIAAEVLWKMFASCSAECQAAIAMVAKNRDGFCGNPEDYFTDFIDALQSVQGYPVKIRVIQ